MTLKQILEEQFSGEERENVLDELFLAGIEMSDLGEFDVGRTLQEIRETIFTKGSINSGPLADLDIKKLKELGIIDLENKKLVEFMKQNHFINEEGFVVGGSLEKLYTFNVYTGTLLDGPEEDEFSVDYYGCKPKKDSNGRIIGYYDAAGYDRHGFNAEGFHRITGQQFDERGFRKTEDGRWVNIFQDDPARQDVDLLGFNYEGINPETGFDRDGFWHEQNPDGTFKLAKSIYAAKGPNKGLNVIGFNSKGWYKGRRDQLKDERGFYADRKYNQYVKNPFYKEGYDIEGFREDGFNRRHIHRYTSSIYNLSGRDANGVLDKRIKAGRDLLKSILQRKSTSIPHISKEDLGKTIMMAMSLERIYELIPEDSTETVKYFMNRIAGDNKLAEEVLGLPSGIPGYTIGDIYDRQLEDLRKYNEFYKGKAKQAEQKKNDRKKHLERQIGRVHSSYRDDNQDDFIR